MSQKAKRKVLAFVLAPLWFLLIFILMSLGALPYNLRCACGRFLGQLVMRLKPQRYRVALTNLGLCFPLLSDHARTSLAKKHFYSLGMCILETGFAWGVARWHLSSCLTIEGKQYWEEAKKNGQGVILISAHTASPDLMGVALAKAGLSYHAMARRQKNEFINWFAAFMRRAYAQSVFYQGEQMRCCRLLRRGENFLYFPDQDYGAQHSRFVPFFGVPAATVVATEKMAKIGRAKVIPVFFFRDELSGRYRLIFSSPIDNSSGQCNDVLEACNLALEKGISLYPEQYLWAHKRFKSVQAGRESVYAEC